MEDLLLKLNQIIYNTDKIYSDTHIVFLEEIRDNLVELAETIEEKDDRISDLESEVDDLECSTDYEDEYNDAVDELNDYKDRYDHINSILLNTNLDVVSLIEALGEKLGRYPANKIENHLKDL
jgi:hypothetical protein